MEERPALGAISPCFIVSDLAHSIAFYESLGFETRVLLPEADPFFAIVGRDAVQIHLKNPSDDTREVPAQPNHTRHPWARLDAFVFLEDPDALAQELAARGVSFRREVEDTEDGLRGFEICDRDGYVLFFGRPRDA